MPTDWILSETIGTSSGPQVGERLGTGRKNLKVVENTF